MHFKFLHRMIQKNHYGKANNTMRWLSLSRTVPPSWIFFLGLWTLMITAISIFTGIYKKHLQYPDEVRSVHIAYEMKAHSSYFIPLYNNIPRLDKPPLFYNLVSLTQDPSGQNNVGSRIVPAYFSFCLLLVTFLFCLNTYGIGVAITSTLVIATMPLFLIFSRTIIFDMPLTFFVCSSSLSAYVAINSNNREKQIFFSWLSWSCAGIGTLIKGPIGCILPFLSICSFIIVKKPKNTAFFYALRNVGTFILIIIAGYAPIIWERPDFLYYGIIKESFLRFTTESAFNRGGGWYYYFLLIPIVCFPWSIFIPQIVFSNFKSEHQAQSPSKALILTVFLITIFFTLSQSKLPGYILPCTVFLGIPTGEWIFNAIVEPLSISGKTIRKTISILSISLILIGFFLIVVYLSIHLFSFDLIFKIQDWRITDLINRLLTYFFILILIGCILFYFRGKYLLVTVLTLSCFTPLSLYFFNTLDNDTLKNILQRNTDTEKLITRIDNFKKNEAELAFYDSFEANVLYKFKEKIYVITNSPDHLGSHYISFTLNDKKNWPSHLIPMENISNFITSRQSSLLVIFRNEASLEVSELIKKIDKTTTIHSLNNNWSGAYLPKIENTIE